MGGRNRGRDGARELVLNFLENFGITFYFAGKKGKKLLNFASYSYLIDKWN